MPDLQGLIMCNKIQVFIVFSVSFMQFSVFLQLHGLSVLILDISESTLHTSIAPRGYIYMRSPMFSLNKTLGAHAAKAH